MNQYSTSLVVLTGASRGLGLAMAQQFLASGSTVLCLSRRIQPDLADWASRHGGMLIQWSQDLSDSSEASVRLHSWLTECSTHLWESATLINNAGVIPGLLPLSEAKAEDLVNALRVGLEAPMTLCIAFLNATASWDVPRKILNISSGLGRFPMASLSGYCAAKAGLDHFTRCLAIEESLKSNGAKVCSLAPGVIDTDMQTHLRQADAAQFPDHQVFVGMHSLKQLRNADDVATDVLAYLKHADFGSNPVDELS